MHAAIHLKRFYSNLNILANQKDISSNFRSKYLPQSILGNISPNAFITFLFMSVNLRFESPVFNLKIKQLGELNPNVLIYSFGVEASYNYFVNFLGNNTLNLFKKLTLVSSGLSTHLRYLILGSYRNNFNYNMVDLLKNIIINNRDKIFITAIKKGRKALLRKKSFLAYLNFGFKLKGMIENLVFCMAF